MVAVNYIYNYICTFGINHKKSLTKINYNEKNKTLLLSLVVLCLNLNIQAQTHIRGFFKGNAQVVCTELGLNQTLENIEVILSPSYFPGMVPNIN